METGQSTGAVSQLTQMYCLLRIINHISVALVRNTFHGYVEPMPHTGKVNVLWLGMVRQRYNSCQKCWYGISTKVVSQCKMIGDQCIHYIHQMNHRIGSSQLCLNCLVRQGVSNVSNVSNLCVTKN